MQCTVHISACVESRTRRLDEITKDPSVEGNSPRNLIRSERIGRRPERVKAADYLRRRRSKSEAEGPASGKGRKQLLTTQCTQARRSFRRLPHGLAVRIPGFHPGGPGSTPGMGTVCYFINWHGETFISLTAASLPIPFSG